MLDNLRQQFIKIEAELQQLYKDRLRCSIETIGSYDIAIERKKQDLKKIETDIAEWDENRMPILPPDYSPVKSVKITFENGKEEDTYYPKFVQTKIIYRLQTLEEKEEDKMMLAKQLEVIRNADISLIQPTFSDKVFFWFDKFIKKPILSMFPQRSQEPIKFTLYIDGQDVSSPEYIKSTYPKEKRNYSAQPVSYLEPVNLIPNPQFAKFRIKLFNNGNSVLEDYKLRFSVDGDYDKLRLRSLKLRESETYIRNTWMNNEFGLIEPIKNKLVQQDSFFSEQIVISPLKNIETLITVNWKFLSRDYYNSGKLFIKIIPQFIEYEKTMYVLEEKDCRTEYTYSEELVKGSYTLNV